MLSLGNFPSDKELFTLVCQSVKKFVDEAKSNKSIIGLEIGKINYYDSLSIPQHDFILPSEVRSTGSIKLDRLKEYLLDLYDFSVIENHIINIKDYDDIKTGNDAIFSWTDVMAYSSDLDDGEVFQKFQGKRQLSKYSRDCYFCLSESTYTVADKIRGIKESWFRSHFDMCYSCYNFPGQAKIKAWHENLQQYDPRQQYKADGIMIYDFLNFYLLKDLVSVIRDYLRPIFTMRRHDNLNVDIIETSVITEWLCILSHKNDSDQENFWFLNCNPKSKFYGYVFLYNPDYFYDIEPIHIVNLI